jgi:hypothetical protein
MMLTAVLAPLLLAAQEGPDRPPKRRAVRSEVRILVEEHPKGEFDHDYYEQLLPVELRSGSAGVQSSIWYRTVCRPQEEDRSPIWIPARTAPPTSFPLSLSAAAAAPRLRISASPAQILTITGSARKDPGTTPPTIPPGPTSTKPALFGGGGENDHTSSDAPILYGPEFDLVVSSDVRWLPEGTSLHLFARALFGSVEMFDTPTELQLYAVGPRLTVPLAKAGSLELGLTVSAGPAFLHSALGDAVGFDGGLGLRLEHVLAPTVSFVAAAEANLYFSGHVTCFGPVVHLGFNLAW